MTTNRRGAIVVPGSAEKLIELYLLFIDHLLQAVSGEKRPPAALLSIIRKTLADNGISVASGAVTSKDALSRLAAVVLPFGIPKVGKVATKATDETLAADTPKAS